MTNTHLKTLAFVAALSLTTATMPAFADQTTSTRLTQTTAVDFVSASEAKRVVRRYLNELGFNRSIGPGGAHIKQVALDADTWVVTVRVRGHSATSVSDQTLYISSETGLVSEVAPQGSARAANPVASIK